MNAKLECEYVLQICTAKIVSQTLPVALLNTKMEPRNSLMIWGPVAWLVSRLYCVILVSQGEEPTQQESDPYASVRMADTKRQEPEKIRIWREEQREMLLKKGVMFIAPS